MVHYASGNVSFDGGSIKLDGNFPTGTNNVALGDGALSGGSLSGNHNIAIGDNALDAATSLRKMWVLVITLLAQ